LETLAAEKQVLLRAALRAAGSRFGEQLAKLGDLEAEASALEVRRSWGWLLLDVVLLPPSAELVALELARRERLAWKR